MTVGDDGVDPGQHELLGRRPTLGDLILEDQSPGQTHDQPQIARHHVLRACRDRVMRCIVYAREGDDRKVEVLANTREVEVALWVEETWKFCEGLERSVNREAR